MGIQALQLGTGIHMAYHMAFHCAGEWVQPAPDYQTGSGGLSFVRDRVSRLVHRGCTIGTCFRLAHGIILTW
jgi:hypothetical protein